MKTLLLIASLFVALVSGAAEAALPIAPETEPIKLFNAKEFNADAFAVLSRPDLTGAPRWGAGGGLSYFVTRGLGLGLRGISYDDGGRFIDDIEARILLRAPLWDRVAPYAYVAGTYAFQSEQAGAGAGGGLELRFTRNLAVFGETGLRVTTEGANDWTTSAGIRLVF